MSAITIENMTGVPAEISIFQGTNRVARVPIPQAGSAQIPTTTEYTAQAFTNIGEFSLSSNMVNFSIGSITLLAQVLSEGGFYHFQLVELPGVSPSAITLENTWSSPVQFRLQRPNAPIQILTVVDEHNRVEVSTAQQWTVYAIVNGLKTETVSFTDPNARVTVTAEVDGAYVLMVS